ncbi:MAG: cytochrome c oxidase accessory protein CcoG, partial [Candidatus Kapaibacterium sp.]
MALLDIPGLDDHERFRSELASVQPNGKRKWIYARKPSGVFYRWRTVVSWALLAFFVLAAIVKVDGNQFLLFDILNRHFVLLGFPFWPEDFYLLAVVVLGVIVT